MPGRLPAVLGAGVVLVTVGGVVAVQASAAAESGPAREHAIEAKLDHPHAARPTAASSTSSSLSDEAWAGLVEAFRAKQLQTWVEGVQRAQWYETVAHNLRAQWYATVQRNIDRARAPRRVGYSTGPGGVLACIRHRESRGNYAAVNRSSGAAGAYQFMQGTWNGTAAAAGRQDLVGVNPAQASPADQDAMAQRLLATRGLAPWGGACG